MVGSDDTGGRPVAEVVREAVAGGVTAVQLREKTLSTRAFAEEARELSRLLRPIGIPLVVNDRADVALAAGADGVHVGQDDLPVDALRGLVGAGLLVGLSVTSIGEAAAVDAALVDYVGVGPVFATATKPDAAPALGIEGTRSICRVLCVPSVAIGGIDVANAALVRTTGVAGIAVVSAICRAARPGEAAARLRPSVAVRGST